MPTIDLVYTEEGIPTAKEAWLSGEREATESNTWLDEILKGSELEREKRRLAQEYARELAKLNAQRIAEVRAVQERARRYTLMLQQQVEEREREKTKAEQATAEVEQQFRTLADEWLGETGHLSDPVKIFMHPSHLKIIGMGEKALPFILKEVERMSGHWFVALDSISQENPVGTEDETNLQRVAKAWLDWGKEKGLI